MANAVRSRDYYKGLAPRDGTEARERLREVLMWIAPDGLTDDCPARRKLAA